jgi:hypothetical protein
MDQMRMLKIVEQYSRLGELVDEEITVMRVPDWKTVYLEQSDGMGRAIIMNEYKVNGKTFWAGYSPRSQTVYVSRA